MYNEVAASKDDSVSTAGNTCSSISLISSSCNSSCTSSSCSSTLVTDVSKVKESSGAACSVRGSVKSVVPMGKVGLYIATSSVSKSSMISISSDGLFVKIVASSIDELVKLKSPLSISDDGAKSITSSSKTLYSVIGIGGGKLRSFSMICSGSSSKNKSS